MDRLTWAFNQTAFFDILRECVQYREPANFLLVRINEYNSLLRIHQYENLAQVRSNISEILRDTGTKREATWCIALVPRPLQSIVETKSRSSVCMNSFYPICQKRWEIEDEVIKTNYCYYLLAYEGDDTSFEKLVQWIHYARSDHKAHHKQGELSLCVMTL